MTLVSRSFEPFKTCRLINSSAVPPNSSHKRNVSSPREQRIARCGHFIRPQRFKVGWVDRNRNGRIFGHGRIDHDVSRRRILLGKKQADDQHYNYGGQAHNQKESGNGSAFRAVRGGNRIVGAGVEYYAWVAFELPSSQHVARGRFAYEFLDEGGPSRALRQDRLWRGFAVVNLG
jgi:hypothetical protein